MPRLASLDQRLALRLAAIEQAGETRRLRSPTGIDLASNDYLGLAQCADLRRSMSSAAMQAGAGSTGSRLLRGERDGFTSLEQRFAKWKGTARSLYFTSGYLANLGVLATIPEAGDVIFSDQFNHASLIDGMRMSKAGRAIFPHNDAASLERLLRETPCAGQRFVVVESLYSMEGDFAPLRELAELCERHDAALIVDEAHAVGIYGDTGSGWVEETGTTDRVFLSVNTAGKALGVAGAFAAGGETAIEYLLQRARTFIFSTAAPPPVAAAIASSLDVIEAQPERRKTLRELARWFRAELVRRLAFDIEPTDSPIVPIVIGDSEQAVEVAARLQQDGFDVRAIRPPTVPVGTARLRVSLHYGLERDTLERFLDRLHAVWKPSN